MKYQTKLFTINFRKLILCFQLKSQTKESPEVDDDIESLKHKKAALDLMEAEWRSEIGFQGLTSFVYGSTCSSWVRHGTSLLTNVVQNIEVIFTFKFSFSSSS
jgi:vacuolar protein sorting-associated protein 13D